MSADLAARYRAACAALGLPVWRPGMRTGSKFERVVAVDAETGDAACAEAGATEDDNACVWMPYDLTAPDFGDPATVGCLLAAAREVWRDPGLCVSMEWKSSAAFWWCVSGVSADEYRGMPRRPPMATECLGTEAEALIIALEAAAVRASEA